MEERFLALLKLLAYEQRPCKYCGQMLYLIQSPPDRSALGAFYVKEHWVVVLDGEGKNHADECSGLIRKRSPEQPNLLGIGAERNGFDPD